MEVEMLKPSRQLPDLPRSSSSAIRCLFGPVDHQENRQFLKELSAKLDEECNTRWNFDFKSDSPLPGRFSWERLGGSTSSNENSPVAVSPTPGGRHPTGGYRLRVGMRSILKKHKTALENSANGSPTRQETPENGRSLQKHGNMITNFESQPHFHSHRLQKALLDFQSDVQQSRGSPDVLSSPLSCKSTAVQYDLMGLSSSSSSSSSSASSSTGSSTTTASSSSSSTTTTTTTATTGDSTQSEHKSTTTADQQKDVLTACRKRKQPKILEYFPKKKSRTEGHRVNLVKRRLDL